jgi:hypothetical protein
MAESDSSFNILLLDTVDTILKMQAIKGNDKEKFQFKYLPVHILVNMNKMYEIMQNH